MDVAAERPEFEPPPQPGRLFGFVLALLAHALLVVALMWGLRWQRESEDVAAEAELWSAVPQQAATREVTPPAPPPPQVKPEPQPQPRPVPKVEPKPEPPKAREPDINIEKQKKLEAQKRAQEDEARKEAAARKEEARKEEARKERERAEAQKREREQQQRLAEEKRRKLEEEQKRKEKQQEKQQEERLAKLREETLKRLQGMAGGTSNSPNSSTAARSSGPSSSWSARVNARVRPNIVFTDVIAGNPKAEVEVRLAPDGTIVGKRLVKSSGVSAWDEAVLRALDKTEVLPRDSDGQVPTPVILEFRPKD